MVAAMATGITLSECQQHLADAQDALTRARKQQGFSIGDFQSQRATVAQLQREVQYWSRLVREKTDAAAGVKNPGFLVPKWE